MPIWEGFGEKIEQVKSKFSYDKDQKVCFSLFFSLTRNLQLRDVSDDRCIPAKTQRISRSKKKLK